MVSTTSGIARRSSLSPTNDEGNLAEMTGKSWSDAELVAHHGVDARGGHAAAREVTAGRGEHGAVGVADGVHRDAVDDQQRSKRSPRSPMAGPKTMLLPDGCTSWNVDSLPLERRVRPSV